MKASILFLSIITSVSFQSFAQLNGNASVYNRQTSSILQDLRKKPNNPRAKNYYHYQDWFVGDVTLNNEGVLRNKPIRYEILRNHMEISANNEVLVLEARKIKSFQIVNTRSYRTIKFIPCAQFDLGEEKIIGFFEVLSDGEIQLLSHKSIVVFGATQSVALSGSHRENDVFINERFFIARDGKIQEVAKRRKKDLLAFGTKADQVRKFANKNGLVFKRKEDLVEMVDYYNTVL